MNISSAMKTAKNVITANSPALLVGTAIAGVVTTGVLAAKAGYKARAVIDEAQEAKGDELTLQEKAQATWLLYVPPAITAATTVAAAVGVHTIHTKRHAAMAGLYAVATTKMDAYSAEAEKLLGAKKTQELNNAYTQKMVDANPIDNTEVLLVEGEDVLFLDEYGGRWFTSSTVKVEEAVNTANRCLLSDEEYSLNDFYTELGLESNQIGTRIGWRAGDKVEVRFGTARTPDGRPALSFRFLNEPRIGRVS